MIAGQRAKKVDHSSWLQLQRRTKHTYQALPIISSMVTWQPALQTTNKTQRLRLSNLPRFPFASQTQLPGQYTPLHAMADMDYEYQRAAPSPTLNNLFGIYPIRRAILACLSIHDVLKLMQTSRTIRQDMKANEWDINAKLARFFKNPVAFRNQLGRSGALIIGSFALQFFERVVWPDTSLDLMVEDGDSFREMCHFLTSEHYRWVAAEPTAALNSSGVKSVRTRSVYWLNNLLTKKQINTWTRFDGFDEDHEARRACTSIELLVTSDMPVKGVLCYSPTSAALNFITWNKAYAVFPRATFLTYETVPLSTMTTELGAYHIKSSIRGWRMRTEAVAFRDPNDCTQPLGNMLARGHRRIGDRDTWMIRLDCEGLCLPLQPDFVLENSGFQVRYISRDPDTKEGGLIDAAKTDSWPLAQRNLPVVIRCSKLQSPCLRYQYTTGPTNQGIGKEFRNILARNLVGQILKFPAEEREELLGGKTPQEIFRHISSNRPIKFRQPRGWDFLDDTIPDIYKNWESKWRWR